MAHVTVISRCYVPCRDNAVGVVVGVGVPVALGDRLGDVAVVARIRGPGGVAELLRETGRGDGGQGVAHVVGVADRLARELGGREAAEGVVVVTRQQHCRPSRYREQSRY